MENTTKRVRILKKGEERQGQVIYWMSRDQRVEDNWALLYAQQLALKQNTALATVFCLVPAFLGAGLRQYDFMLKGLEEVERALAAKRIPFYVLLGKPEEEIPVFVESYGVSSVVTDFDPLRAKRKWKKAVTNRVEAAFYEVDAHNIVPCWVSSEKQEYGAYTLRPKLKRTVPEFLVDFPSLRRHRVSWPGDAARIDWGKCRRFLKVDRSVKSVDWVVPGEDAASRVLRDFLRKRIDSYKADRNDPTRNGQSGLSPYLHFGQISAQRVALEVSRSSKNSESKQAFLEELIVRRELSDNFCFCNLNYDKSRGFPAWARKTLDDHRNDAREYVYSLEEFEKAKTHDELWNAAQKEMVYLGKMHGYMRMYWAKKILEWTESPEEALKIAIYLNDKYELDGRDPNGYAGIAWSIGGVHDRAWRERPVFGKIRYMSYSGCKSKFDVDAYIDKVNRCCNALSLRGKSE